MALMPPNPRSYGRLEVRLQLGCVAGPFDSDCPEWDQLVHSPYPAPLDG